MLLLSPGAVTGTAFGAVPCPQENQQAAPAGVRPAASDQQMASRGDSNGAPPASQKENSGGWREAAAPDACQ
jgi:hypothetical protein